MLKNYIKIALRHIRKNKGFSLLNILGLSLGLTCAILILLWIQDEVSYNKFHQKYSVLYQVMENQAYDGKVYTFAATPGQLASGMKQDFPEVVRSTRMGWGERWLFELDDKPIYENGNYVDPEFFEMFSFDFIQGNKRQALLNDHSIVLSEKMAKKFFGDRPALGRYLRVNDKTEFQVSAVVRDAPQNSTIKFDWLVSFSLFEKENEWLNDWATNGLQTFAELKPFTSLAGFNRKFCKYIKSKNAEASAEPLLLPMKDWRLRNNFEEGKQSGGRIEYVRLFGAIAVLLVLIACINFMNLATARSEQRAREVGVRKVMGAQRRTLILQFIGESIVMAFFSMLGACLLALLCLPLFNQLVVKELSLGFDQPEQWLIFFSITLFCGFISGSYPSFFLSSFKPAAIFKGTSQGRSGHTALIRKGLVVTQFVVSIVLIVSTVVIYKQIQHVKNRQLGIKKEKLLYLTQKGMMNENLGLIFQDLKATGAINHVASSNQRVIQMGSNSGGFQWDGKDASKDVLVTTEYVSPDYVNTVGMKIIQGRDFYPSGSIDSNNVIINETFAKIIGKKDPVGQTIWRDSTGYTVVGVVKDFVYNDMYKKPDPVLIFQNTGATRFIFISLNDKADVETSLAKIEGVLKKNNPGYPFEYSFLDEDFDKQFRSEILISKLSRIFALITIIISCLGLFGLAAYTAERRTREIGIRKVLGATIQNVVGLLSKDFIRLVLIAVIIAVPVSWYIMDKWLQDYSYRISVQWWMFAVAGTSALAIALFTVSFQAIRAALANPVKSLRTE